jgi:hypothetical protein
MRFADARRAEDQDVFGLREEMAGGELADQTLIDRRLEFELERVEGLYGWEMRDLQAHRDAGALLRVDFLAQHAVEEIEIGRFGAGGVAEHRIKPLGHVAQAQPRELLHDTRMHDRTHWPPPATTAA